MCYVGFFILFYLILYFYIFSVFGGERYKKWSKITYLAMFLSEVGYETLTKLTSYKLWGPIDPIGTIRMGKGWAYGPIPSPRIRAYPRTISKGRSKNCIIGRGKEYL